MHSKMRASLLHANYHFEKDHLTHEHMFSISISHLNSSIGSTNTSLSIGFSWRETASTSMVLQFHHFHKNSVKASCTDSLQQVGESVCCWSVSSCFFNFLPSVVFSVNTYIRYTFLASVSNFVKHYCSSNFLTLSSL